MSCINISFLNTYIIKSKLFFNLILIGFRSKNQEGMQTIDFSPKYNFSL
jgi:hypothetical protein